MEANNNKEMHEVVELVAHMNDDGYWNSSSQICNLAALASAALDAPPHTGKWKNGKKFEYEYAYCSVCGRMQWADWDSHNQAEENIEAFAERYRFCPGCGAKMEGGVYVK